MKSLFWMKQISFKLQNYEKKPQTWKFRFSGTLRNTFVHGPSFISFHFLSFSISFPKLAIFTILRLNMACKIWETTALTWEKNSIPPLSPCVILYIIGLESMKLQNWKKKQEASTKDMNEMEWHKMDYLIFLAMRMRKRHLFCTSSHQNVPHGEDI